MDEFPSHKQSKKKSRKVKRKKTKAYQQELPVLVKKTPKELAEEQRSAFEEDPVFHTETEFDTHRQMVSTRGTNRMVQNQYELEHPEYRAKKF